MENNLPVILVLILGFAAIFIYLNKKLSNKNSDQTLLEWLKSMQVSLDQANKTLNESLRDTNKNITSTLQSNTKDINQRLDNAARVISAVQKNIGEMSEIGRGMKDLQEFLRSPKLRGNIGEQVLKELLGQMLPKQSFHLQYSFKSGSIVDAAIKTEAGIIPIDSKFPMENFRKMSSSQNDNERKGFEKEFVTDVKKHIDTISNKYILTNEGTIDYALMYIPSESIYYEIINNPALFDYSSGKRVLPVSPMTFYAYLKAILMGFEGQKISKKAHEILSGIRAIQKEYEKLGESIDTLSKHINNSYNMVNQVQGGYSKLGRQIVTTSKIDEEEIRQLEN
ncbi:MAG: hypothetical protein A2857_02940 [Candidatus Levybacteria bacterium RIFCSPHIGHO2_01_FULL_36_15]|nr:MAG: hypothetical protein A2857_02940 [Candidatus Levybacteria bacterium RIFCSPHIGHO2_01_FULL_36_15]OGH38739.1 MAG: hypothetical protein A2905_06745 [Candidatus Levybacteria bacterium RIFCSPLOWO2_01_FULL_36_10]